MHTYVAKAQQREAKKARQAVEAAQAEVDLLLELDSISHQIAKIIGLCGWQQDTQSIKNAAKSLQNQRTLLDQRIKNA